MKIVYIKSDFLEKLTKDSDNERILLKNVMYDNSKTVYLFSIHEMAGITPARLITIEGIDYLITDNEVVKIKGYGYPILEDKKEEMKEEETISFNISYLLQEEMKARGHAIVAVDTTTTYYDLVLSQENRNCNFNISRGILINVGGIEHLFIRDMMKSGADSCSYTKVRKQEKQISTKINSEERCLQDFGKTLEDINEFLKVSYMFDKYIPIEILKDICRTTVEPSVGAKNKPNGISGWVVYSLRAGNIPELFWVECEE